MLKQLKSEDGFTFIEVMIAVVIVSIAAVGLMYGTVHAKGELRALYLKERATDILVNYTEYWKGKINAGEVSYSELINSNTPKQVAITMSDEDEEGVLGEIFYEIRNDVPSAYSEPTFKRRRLKTWIVWEHSVFGEGAKPERREIETIVTILPL